MTASWLNSDGTRRRGTIPPTVHRTSAGPDHRQPASGLDRTGQPWKGTSRIVDRRGRRKANKLSWHSAIRRSAQAARAVRESQSGGD